MKVSVSDWSETQKKVTVEIPPERVQPQVERVYRDFSAKVRIKGFRQGKVPRSVIKGFYGKQIEAEVAQDLIDKTFSEALESQHIKPLAQAELESFSYHEDGGLLYTAIVEVMPTFEARGYVGMELKKPPFKPVDDAEIAGELERLRKERAEFVVLEGQAAEDGLTVICSLSPLDEGGEVVQDKVLRDVEVTIGMGEFHSELERSLIGLKADESRDVEVSFDETAPEPSWRGKRMRLRVSVGDVGRRTLPDLDDAFAKDVGYESLDTLRRDIQERLEKARVERQKDILRRQIETTLLEKHDLPIPEKTLAQMIERQISDVEMMLYRQGVRFPEDLFKTDKMRDSVRPKAERVVKLEMILDKIAAQEGIRLTDEEEREIVTSLARVLRIPEEEAEAKAKGSHLWERLTGEKLRAKVFDWIESHAVIVEAPPEERDTHREEGSATLEGEAR